MPARGARRGYWLGGARRGRAVGASAAPCSADFDPPGRTAPAGRGPRAAQRPRRSRLVAGGHADHRPRVTGQGGSRPRVLFPCPSVGGVRVFVGAIGVERSLHRGGGGGGGEPRRPAPSRAQEGGREHPRRGWPPGPASPPSCGARSETFVRCPLDQFFCELWVFSVSSRPGPQSRAGAGVGGPASRG